PGKLSTSLYAQTDKYPFDQEDEDEDEDDPADEIAAIDLIRQRVVWVLGEIGDEPSLSALEKLVTTAQPDSPLMCSVTDAIEKIRKTGPYAPPPPGANENRLVFVTRPREQ